MTTDLDTVRVELIASVDAADSLDALEAARVAAVGKKGRVGALMKQLGALPAEDRKDFGQSVNAVKQRWESAIELVRRITWCP